MTHLLRQEHVGLGTMRALYAKLAIIPTSENADVVLIRSWLAYWSGQEYAETAIIRPSRGHTYSVAHRGGAKNIVRISDYYDHRDGVGLVVRP